MGGVVNVAVRFPDGRAVCQERWTNNTPHWFKNAKLFNGDVDHVQAYLDLTKGNDFKAGELGKPQPLRNSEYGLIVIDLLTMTFLDNNTYSHFNNWSPVMLYGNRHDDDDRKEFYELVDQGRILAVRHTWNNSDSRGTINKEVNPNPLSRSEADEIGRKWAENFMADSRRDRSPNRIMEEWSFQIKTDPFEYIEFDELDTTNMRKKLRELNFPMTKKEGLNV